MRKDGFTLIELLVVVGVTGIVGIMVAGLFLSTLRTAAKTKALTEIKQNGDYAMAVMGRMIRNAKQVQSLCPGSGSAIKILNPDEKTTEFICDSVNQRIASNSGIFLTSDKLEIPSCSFTCQELSYKPAVITINFTLRKGDVALGKEFTAEIPFQLTVSTRIY